MSKTHKGTYKPKNPEKYLGDSDTIYYRSTWELTFMRKCDDTDAILEWSSEPFRIPFYHPLKNKQSMYVPDFLIVYVDKNGDKHTEVIEVKPAKETVIEKAKSTRDKANLAVNAAKWKAAQEFALRHGLKFRVLTEYDIFANPR